MTEETAASIRKRVRELRGKFSPQDLRTQSEAVVSRLTASTGILQKCAGKKIGIYRSLPGEVELLPFEVNLRIAKARLYFPRYESKDGPLEFVEMSDASSPFVGGLHGIEQPAPELPTADPAELEVVIVPGMAFGRGGQRVGRGAGHFDRYLPLAKQAVRVALAFDFQLFAELPQSSWDQPVHWIFTQSHEIRVGDESPLFR